jgi:solute carrier family 25 (mitochondrial dicarboxylate transporter), member 10
MLHPSLGPHQSVRFPQSYTSGVFIDWVVPSSRMQTLRLKDGSKRPSTFSVIRYSIGKEGLRSLYTGLSASLLRQMTYSLVRIGSYEEMKRRMAQTGSSSTGKLLLAASAAGGLGGIAGNPAGKFPKHYMPSAHIPWELVLDILMIRMTSDSVRPPEKRYSYPNALSGLVTLIKEEGIRGLARGVGTNTTRAVLMNASVQFLCHNLSAYFSFYVGVSSRIVSVHRCVSRAQLTLVGTQL